MQTYLVYYWLHHGDRHLNPLCQRVEAESYDACEKLIETNLEKNFFSFESDSHGRVLVVSQHVRYVEIENHSCMLPDNF